MDAAALKTPRRRPSPRGDAARQRLAAQLRALGDPMRLRILRLLPVEDRCEDVYNVTELAGELGLAQPTVSHHLQVLRHAGLVRSRKMCRDVYYWIDLKQLRRVWAGLDAVVERPATRGAATGG